MMLLLLVLLREISSLLTSHTIPIVIVVMSAGLLFARITATLAKYACMSITAFVHVHITFSVISC